MRTFFAQISCESIGASHIGTLIPFLPLKVKERNSLWKLTQVSKNHYIASVPDSSHFSMADLPRPLRANSPGHGKCRPSSREQSAGCMSWCPKCSLHGLAARPYQLTALQWKTETSQSGERDVGHECGHNSNCQIKKTISEITWFSDNEEEHFLLSYQNKWLLLLLWLYQLLIHDSSGSVTEWFCNVKILFSAYIHLKDALGALFQRD